MSGTGGGKRAGVENSRVVEAVVDVGLELCHGHHLAADKAGLHCLCGCGRAMRLGRGIVRSVRWEMEAENEGNFLLNYVVFFCGWP